MGCPDEGEEVQGSLLQPWWRWQAPRQGFFFKKKKKKVDPNACRRCEKMGHWARECPNLKQEKKAQAHLAQSDDEDEATILMATFYALHDVEAEEWEEATTMEGPGNTTPQP